MPIHSIAEIASRGRLKVASMFLDNVMVPNPFYRKNQKTMTINIIAIYNWFVGKRTYIVAIAAGVVITLQVLGYISADTATNILKYLGVAGTITMAAKINRAINQAKPNV